MTSPITEAPFFKFIRCDLNGDRLYFSNSVLDLQAFFQRCRRGGEELCRLGHMLSFRKTLKAQICYPRAVWSLGYRSSVEPSQFAIIHFSLASLGHLLGRRPHGALQQYRSNLLTSQREVFLWARDYNYWCDLEDTRSEDCSSRFVHDHQPGLTASDEA